MKQHHWLHTSIRIVVIFQFLLSLIFPVGALAFVASQALPLAPAADTTLSVAILSSPDVIYDSNPQSGKPQPQVFVVEAVVTNEGAFDAENVLFTLDFNAGLGWELLPGEDPVREIDLLAVGESYHAYWFATYPLSVATHTYTVSAIADNAPLVSTSTNFYIPNAGYTVATASALSTGNSGITQTAANVTVGVKFLVNISYNLGTKPQSIHLSPVGNLNFRADAYRLLHMEIQFYSDTNQPIGLPVQDQIFLPLADIPANAVSATASFEFIAIKPAATSLCPYAAIKYTNFKYDQFFCNPGTTEVPIEGSVSLQLKKVANKTLLQQDETITYTIYYTNTGTLPLSFAWIWDEFDPAILTPNPASISPLADVLETDLAAGRIAWFIDHVGAANDPGSTGMLTFTAAADGKDIDIPDGAVNTDNAYFGIEEGALPNTAVLTSTHTSTIQAPALSVTKTNALDPIVAGDATTYVITIENTGSVAATGLSLVDTLPTYVVQDGSSAPTPAPADITGKTITWNLPDLAAGAQTSVSVPVIFDITTPHGTVVSNTATATFSNSFNYTFITQSGTDATTVNNAVMSISKEASTDPVLTGNELVYTLTYQNTGAAPAENVFIHDTLPVGTSYVSCAGGTSCLNDNGVVTWDIGTVAVGPAASVSMTVLVDSDLESGSTLNNTTYDLTSDQSGKVNGAEVVTQVLKEAALFDVRAYEDINRNGIYDDGIDAPLADVVMTLPEATVSPQTTTLPSGMVQFRVETSDPIHLSAGDLVGYIHSTPAALSLIPVLGGETPTVVNFGYIPDNIDVGVVSGTVYADANHNGSLDDTEAGLSGVTVSSTQAVVTDVTTQMFGWYTLFFTSEGLATVTEVNPPGYVSTTPDSFDVTIAFNSVNGSPHNFGDYAGVKITGTVFDDQDASGTRDAEPGLAGATVSAGTDSFVTVDGSYTLYAPAGSPITISESDPSTAYVSTNAIPGSPAVTRVDANTLQILTPAAGSTYAGNDFGDTLKSGVVTISGQVWNDNGAGAHLANGLRDADELGGLPGATLSLSSGMQTTSGPDGTFTLYAPALTAVTLTETNPPSGYTSTNAIPGNNATKVDNDNLLIAGLPANGLSANNLFGDVQTSAAAVLTGTVFNDLDSDGVLNGAEPGIPGVTVTLVRAGLPDIIVLTNANGVYQFAVQPGTAAQIVSSGPTTAGFHATTPEMRPISNPLAGLNPAIDFGYSNDEATSVIYGLVFNDLNANGVLDFGEPGLPGLQVEVTGVGTTLTGSAGAALGAYSFSFTPGNPYYEVKQTTQLPTFRSTSPDQVVLAVAPGQSYQVNFGDSDSQSNGPIYGKVFDDLDQDGVQDAGEPGLAGVKLTLFAGISEVTFKLTDQLGRYSFDVAAGNFTVTSIDPALPGYRSTTPDSVNVLVVPGNSNEVNFGDTQAGYATIFGTVFNDFNGNGEQDPTELGIAGVSIHLFDGQTLIDKTTGQFGTYTFPAAQGLYQVTEDPDPDGFFSTTPNLVMVNVDQPGLYEVNFGDSLNPGSQAVFGTVFNDADGDGLFDLDEAGIAGVTLTLDQTTGTNPLHATFTTNQWGQYTFLIDQTGMYSLVETDLPDYFSTTPNIIHINAIANVSYEVDFGDALKTANFAIVLGTVFEDLNENALWDANEPGIPAVQGFPLITIDGVTASAQTTDAYGSYRFKVAAGVHQVNEQDQVGYQSSTPNTVNTADLNSGETAVVNFGDFKVCVGASDLFEQDDAVGAAKLIAFGAANKQAHNFVDDASDWVKFTAQARGTYTITVDAWGVRTDSFIRLVDTDQVTELMVNDDLANSQNFSSQLVFYAQRAGTYYVQVLNRNNLTGCYTEYDLTVEEKPDPTKYYYLPLILNSSAPQADPAPQAPLSLSQLRSFDAASVNGPESPDGEIIHVCPDTYEDDDTWEQAFLIQPGDIQKHSFDSPTNYAADKDHVKFTANLFDTVTFTLTQVPGTLTKVELYDENRSWLAEGTDALTWKVTRDGTYYLIITPTNSTFGCVDIVGYNLEMSKVDALKLYLPLIFK